MSKIIFDNAISLDGFFAGENRSLKSDGAVLPAKSVRGCFIKKPFRSTWACKAGKKTVRMEHLSERPSPWKKPDELPKAMTHNLIPKT